MARTAGEQYTFRLAAFKPKYSPPAVDRAVSLNINTWMFETAQIVAFSGKLQNPSGEKQNTRPWVLEHYIYTIIYIELYIKYTYIHTITYIYHIWDAKTCMKHLGFCSWRLLTRPIDLPCASMSRRSG